MSEYLSTLDLAAGMTVQRAGTAGSLLRVTDVREPRHALMPGLVVTGHLYMSGLMYWSPKETVVHDTDGTERWTPVPADDVPSYAVHASGTGWATVTADDGTVYVSQHMVSEDSIRPDGSRYLYVWPITSQRMDALARSVRPDVRLVNDVSWGAIHTDRHRRTYRVPAV